MRLAHPVLPLVGTLLGAHASAAPALWITQRDGNPLDAPGRIAAFDPTTYEPLGIEIIDPDLDESSGLAYSPDGSFYAVSDDEVRRYDATTGAYLGSVAQDHGIQTGWINRDGAEIAISPDGSSFYLGGARRFDDPTSPRQPVLRRYDASTGDVLAERAGLGTAFAFGPGGSLFAADPRGDAIEQIDPLTLETIAPFARVDAPALFPTAEVFGVSHLDFGPDGLLYALAASFVPGVDSYVQIVAFADDGSPAGQTGPLFDTFGFYEVAVNPVNGDLLTLTDVRGIIRVALGETQPNGLGLADTISPEIGFLISSLVFVPEPGAITLLASFVIAASRRRRSTLR